MFKNILTFGGHGRLQREIRDFESLSNFCQEASANYTALVENRSILLRNLIIERNEAVRNFTLLRTLISKYATVSSGEEYEANLDNLTEFVSIKLDKHVEIEDINHEEILDNAIANISKSASRALDRFGGDTKLSSGSYSKKDLKVDALMFGLDVAGDVFDYASNLNAEVNAKRAEVQQRIKRLNYIAENILETYSDIYMESKRIDEIFYVLNRSNQAFINKYKDIVNKYFDDYSLDINSSKFKGYEADFERDLRSLMVICTSYSKNKKINV